MWQHGVAKVVKILKGSKIVVRCPHCRETHTHSILSAGSNEVVAGCHVGGNRCLSYSIPKRERR